MRYVYILESLDSLHFYVGITNDLRARLAKHYAGEVPHTSKYGPWEDQDIRRIQRRDAGCSIREILEVRLRPRLRQEAPLARLLPQDLIQLVAQRDDLVLHRYQFSN